jgi:ATP-binding cassette, subfamily B, bacterial MsbA
MTRRVIALARGHGQALTGGAALLVVRVVLDTIVTPILLAALLVSVVGNDANAARQLSRQVLRFDLGPAINAVVHGHSREQALVFLALAAGAAVVLSSLCETARLYLGFRFSYRVADDLRVRVFAHLVRQSASFLDASSSGTLLSRLTGDIALIQQTLGPKLLDLLQAPLTVGLSVAVMFTLNWRLTLATLALTPVIVYAMSRGGRLARRLMQNRQDRLAALNAYLVERLANIRFVQALGRERFEIETIDRLNQLHYRASMRSVLVEEAIAPALSILALFGMMTGVVLGGLAVIGSKMASAQFILFCTLAPNAGAQLARVARLTQTWQQIAGATERIFALLDQRALEDDPDARPLSRVSGSVRFDRVSFAYRPDEPVLKEIDLELHPGETVALVGPSGAGKSTLASLMLHFYEPTSGRICVDGKDIRRVTRASLREQVGMVGHEAVVFHATVADNLRYGRPDATLEQMREATRAARLLDTVEGLPRGFDTVVGDRGVGLSSGERQRLAIARILLRDPRILVLDEATSALDAENERLVQEAMAGLLRGGRTTLVIAHRLSTLRLATRIAVLDEGRIVEEGTHVELLGRGGVYRRFHEQQLFGPGQAPAGV